MRRIRVKIEQEEKNKRPEDKILCLKRKKAIKRDKESNNECG